MALSHDNDAMTVIAAQPSIKYQKAMAVPNSFLQDQFCNSSDVQEQSFEEVGDF